MCLACSPAKPNRRRFLATLAFTSAALAVPAARAGGTPRTTLTPDQALAALLEGNARFRTGNMLPSVLDPARRAALAAGQAPFATILTCSDSRTGPELLFNAGLGEIFVVRNAGNVANTAEIGSLEYAVAALGVPLVMVLGHENCGAIGAAVALAERDTDLPGSVRDMLLPILPAALVAIRAGGDKTERAVVENVTRMRDRLLRVSPVMAAATAAGRLKVVGARYDLKQLEVTLVA
jgi:carbonic anhydrase